MRIVIAIGGNALQRRGEKLSAANLLRHIREAAQQLAQVAASHELVITHGNGPQIGLLALQAAAYTEVDVYPLDVLGAESVGMIGYLLEQELCNAMPVARSVVALLTRVEVDPDDPAFRNPAKPIGPIYSKAEADRARQEKQWAMAPDGKGYRRVVASPRPQSVVDLAPMHWLLEHGAVVIAAGGGGIPVVKNALTHRFHGEEAVIDKDWCSALVARELGADCLVIATDVEAVYLGWGTSQQRALGQVTPQDLLKHTFPAGSMGPKVEAACQFVRETGKRAAIGALSQIDGLVSGVTGTQISDGAADG
jgi:carbamate kinase